MATEIPGEVQLRTTQLRPLQSATVRFTPQQGVISVTAFAAQVGATKPKGKPKPVPGRGRPGEPGLGPREPGVDDIAVPQDASVRVGLVPPGAKTARKSRTFRFRDLLGGAAQAPLELGVTPADAGKPWTCQFTNAGRTEARISGTVRFVKERREEADEPPAVVSVGKQASLPVTFLRPADPAVLPFMPAEGMIEVLVFAAEVKPGKPTGKLEADPDAGGKSFEIRQNVRVGVELVDPGGRTVARADFRSTKLLADEAPQPVVRHVVTGAGADREWVVRVRNRGESDIRCSARVAFVGRSLRTDIPLRVLNNGLRQLVAGIALTVRLDGRTAFIGVSEELGAFAGDGIGGALAAPVSLPVEFSDFNLFAFGVRARTDTGRPLVTAHARFEARGEEIDDIQFLGVPVADVDIGRLAITVDVAFRTIDARGRRILQPVSTVKVDASVFAEALQFIGVDISTDVVDAIEAGLRGIASSKAFADAVGKYLAQGLVHLVAQGHEFQDLLVEPNRFVVLHVDPTPGKPTGPAQPPHVEFPRPADAPAPVEDATQANLEKIDHIVVLMQENRSFDHVLGYLSHPDHGLGRLQAEGRDVPDGLTGEESNPRGLGGRPVVVAPYPTTDVTVFSRTVSATAVPFGPHHEHDHVVAQVAGGTMRGFAGDFISRFPNVDPQFAMQFYTDEHVPVFDALAATYTICDRWFCSHPGPTQPNRFCTLSGHTPVVDNFAFDDPILGYLRMPTLFDVLTGAGIDWVYYEGDIGFLRTYDRYRLDDEHVIPFDDPADGFLRRAELGLLPPVTFIDPNFTDIPPAKAANDDHAPADLRQGQRLIRDIHDALTGSVHWSRTLFVVTYDEHGGFYDHVAPPGTPPSDQPQAVPPVHPTGDSFFGPRVPTFAISPFVGPGRVDSTVFDHTSIAATILRRFVGEIPPELGPRPATTNHLGGLLSLDEPRRPSPLAIRLPSPATRRFDDTRRDPHDFRASMRALAQPKPA